MKTLLALVSRLDDVCTRYRIRTYLPALQERGWRVRIEPIPKGSWAKRKWLRGLPEADTVVLQRKLLGRSTLEAIRAKAKTLIFDFDDAVFRRDSFATEPARDERRERRFRRTIELADRVFAGNDFLASKADELVPGKQVHVLPTCVQPEDYPVRARERIRGDTSGLVLAWIGSASTLQYMESSRTLLESIGEAVPGAVLKVICDEFPRFHSLRVESVTWSERTERAELASADVGVSPLTDDDWSRGKCGLKLLQYMAAGLPVVANPVGVQAEIVEPGRSGYLPRTPPEWVAALSALHADPERAHMMGQRGRQIVEEKYSVSVWAPRLLEWLGPQ